MLLHVADIQMPQQTSIHRATVQSQMMMLMVVWDFGLPAAQVANEELEKDADLVWVEEHVLQQ